MNRLYVLGAGGMARECIDVIRALGREGEIAGLAEEKGEHLEKRVSGHAVLDVADLPAPSPGISLVCAIGSTRRKDLVLRLESRGHAFVTLIDPRAIVSPSAAIGTGGIVMAGAVVSSDAVVGRHCIVNFGASISHDVRVGDFSTVCPGARVGGHCVIGAETWLGIGCALKDRVNVGERAYVGAGACVVGNIPAGMLAYGVPARAVRPV